jgi:O-antigen/teichoic acid export membrane protein
MTSFAGWNFFTNSAYIFNTQGINLLINIFFDVTVNAARGIATQVESAILMMVNSFTTALNPQITKNYASGNRIEMLSLVFRGAKFSYLLLFIIALPVMLEAEFVLTIWLKLVPIHTVNFVRLAIIASLVNVIGKTGYTASMATGKIRRYVLWVTSVGCMAFPLTWLSFSLGAPSEASYFVFICVYILVEAIRLWVMKDLLDFPVSDFLKEVVLRVMGVTSLAIIIPITFIEFFEPSWLRFIMSTIICMTCSTFSIYIVGLTVNERQMILKVVYNKIGEIRNYCNKIR